MKNRPEKISVYLKNYTDIMLFPDNDDINISHISLKGFLRNEMTIDECLKICQI